MEQGRNGTQLNTEKVLKYYDCFVHTKGDWWDPSQLTDNLPQGLKILRDIHGDANNSVWFGLGTLMSKQQLTTAVMKPL